MTNWGMTNWGMTNWGMTNWGMGWGDLDAHLGQHVCGERAAGV